MPSDEVEFFDDLTAQQVKELEQIEGVDAAGRFSVTDILNSAGNMIEHPIAAVAQIWGDKTFAEEASSELVAKNINTLSTFIAEQNAEKATLTTEQIKALEQAKAALEKQLIALEAQSSAQGATERTEELRAAKIAAGMALNDAPPSDVQRAQDPDVGAEDESQTAEIVQTAQQCFLIYNMQAFSDFHKKLITRAVPQFAPPFYVFPELGDEIQTAGYYSNHTNSTRMFLVDEDTAGYQIVNKLNMKKGSDSFAKIQTHEAAQLIPLLKIFKVYRGVGTVQESSPIDVVEFDFSNQTSLDGIARELTIEHLGQTATSFAKGAEVGVTSFEWQFMGTDPYTATREISATLKLTAQHFSSLVRTRMGEVIQSRPSYTPTSSPLPVTRDYRYIDLIVQPDCRDPESLDLAGNVQYQQTAENHAPECYEIRVDVGYQHPGPNAIMNANIRDNVRCQKDILLLTPIDHSFDFKEDGTVDLTINFMGRTEALMRDKTMNVILPAGGASMESVRFQWRDKSYNLAEAETALKSMKNQPDSDKEGALKEAMEELKTEMSNVYVKNKQFFLSHIMRTLESEGAIYFYRMLEDEYDAFVRWQIESQGIDLYPDYITENDAITGAKTNTANVRSPTLPEEKDTQEALEEVIEEMEAASIEGLQRKINYFFLGDLIAVVLASVTGEDSFQFRPTDLTLGEAAMERLGEDPALVAAALLLPPPVVLVGGSIIAADIGLDLAQRRRDIAKLKKSMSYSTNQDILDNFRMILGNITVKFKNSTESRTINLAHIPISVESFTKFMIDNVLSKDIDNYPFFSFVDDLLSSLVTNLLGTQCFGGLTDYSIRPQAQLFVSPKKLEDVSDIYAPNEFGKPYKTLHLAETNYQNPLFDLCVDSNNIGEHYEYFAISATDTNINRLRGDPYEDRSNGILHVYFGEDRGVVKTVKFNKTDQEYLPEARFASEGEFIFNQLSNVYDVGLEMIGNNLFKIGQHIYIDAESFGAGPSWANSQGIYGPRKRSWASIMGLGGYHLITEVGSSIDSNNGFATTLKARWVGGGQRMVWSEE